MRSPVDSGRLFYLLSEFYNYNGKYFAAGENFISPDNRGFRYGDGLFETMVVTDGKIRLSTYHFERLLNGMKLLKFEIPKLFTVSMLQREILSLCKKNNHHKARVRLAIFRGEGGVYDAVSMQPNFVIQSWLLPENVFHFNVNGLVIDVYPDAAKQPDIFSNIKSANYLPYVMAALHAKENKLNDCLVLNTYGNIADATIANIFLLKGNTLFTPALSEGCVAGVMRRFLITNASLTGFEICEKAITINDVEQADEVFLTNAVYGLRWVSQLREKKYTHNHSKIIYKRLMETINK